MLGAALAVAGCASSGSRRASAPAAKPEPAPSAARMLEHIRVLSSDEYEGRAPATRGEELTVAYLVGQFKKLGLAPGNPDGTYVQAVPLVGIRGRASVSFAAGDKRLSPRLPEEMVAVSRRLQPEVNVEGSSVVFVGYGVVAPEYGWDDYKGVDVRGKTIVMLVNDPPVPDANDPSKLDDKMFRGKAMTYYGRWTYKYEIASEKGAAAAIIVHETGPAGYPYEVVSGSFGRENFDIRKPGGDPGRVAVEAWVSSGTAVALCALGGQDFAELKRRAVSKDFKPVDLGVAASFSIKNETREVDSKNVAAKLEGSDPALKDEYVVYTAHWDHLGKNDSLPGRPIYHGAVDNASGVAGLLELARACAPLKPRRSILFLSVTAEEKGLLGAKYYASSPLYPLRKTLAEINMDGLNVWGRARDVISVGLGNSTLDDVLLEAARAQGRVVKPDPEPEKGSFFRSDHFEFAKLGVPALEYGSGTDYVGKPEDFGRLKRKEFTANDYHKPSDVIKPGWDLSGAAEDVALLMQVGLKVADGDAFPAWKDGVEFKAVREASLRQSPETAPGKR